jgi:hypothetical protein
MVALVEKIARDEVPTTREAVRREIAKPKPVRPKAFVFSYKVPIKAFGLRVATADRESRDFGERDPRAVSRLREASPPTTRPPPPTSR